jgi:zinc D-Ala-D-Ala carboxypeptidase
MTAISLTMKKITFNTVLMVIVLLLMIAYYLIQNRDKYRQTDQNNMVLSTGETDANVKQSSLFRTDTNVSADFLTGKFDPAQNNHFTEVDPEYGKHMGMFLCEDAYIAFIKMFYSAQFDGVTLTIVSAARSFDTQRWIWEAKWSGSKQVEGKNIPVSVKDPIKRASIILTSSSMPGTSRHHWGTDIDINSTEADYFETPKGKTEYEWLIAHASKYGFCQPFNMKDSLRISYEEEKWHWSYVPLSTLFQKAYGKKVDYTYLTGFSGSETAPKLDVIKNYVLSVNTDCIVPKVVY